MKKILLLAALTAALAACTPQTARKTFHLTGFSEFDFPCEGGSALFGIEANPDEAWTLTCDVDWITVIQGFGNGDGHKGTGDAAFHLACGRWTMNTFRTATVTVTGPAGPMTKTLKQAPKPAPKEPLRIAGSIPFSGGEVHIKLPDGYWVSADCASDWLTVVGCEEGMLTVKAGPNPTADLTREAVVTVELSDGTPLATVTVTQRSEKFPVPVD